MSDITWTKGTPTFIDPIEWWRTRTSMEKRPFVVEVEVSSHGSRRAWFFGLANPVPVADLPADYLWGGRIDMGENDTSAPVLPPGWEVDPDCEPTPTGEPWTAKSWESRCGSGPFAVKQYFMRLDGIPVWRWKPGAWCRVGVNETGRLYADVTTPVGTLIPIRRVQT